jgi:hypothetical protein
MVAAHLDEQALIAAYDRAVQGATGQHLAQLNVERAIHATHLAALKRYPPPAGRGGAVAVIPPATLPASLRASAAARRRDALAATDGNNAALLASIAASHEVSAGG